MSQFIRGLNNNGLEDQRLKLECQLYMFFEAASRLWLHSFLDSASSAYVFQDVLTLAIETLKVLKRGGSRPMSERRNRSAIGHINVFTLQFAWQPSLLPDISTLYGWCYDDHTWECVVIAALVVYYIEAEGVAGDISIHQDTAILSITIENDRRRGTLTYARVVDGKGEQQRELVITW